MPLVKPQEIRVSVDVDYHQHSVAIGLSTGQLLEEFDIEHTSSGFKTFFNHIEHWEKQYNYPVSVAMEGYNGLA